MSGGTRDRPRPGLGYRRAVALKKFLEKFTASAEDRDREAMMAAVAALAVTPMADLVLRTPQQIAGEIESVRVVPRAAADAIEATVTDGTGRITAVFLGRRRIPGISPGRRVMLDGVPTRQGSRVLLYNPSYRLLTAR